MKHESTGGTRSKNAVHILLDHHPVHIKHLSILKEFEMQLNDDEDDDDGGGGLHPFLARLALPCLSLSTRRRSSTFIFRPFSADCF